MADTEEIKKEITNFIEKLEASLPKEGAKKPTGKAKMPAKKKEKPQPGKLKEAVEEKDAEAPKPDKKMFYELPKADRVAITIFFAIAQTNNIGYDEVIPKIMEKFNVSIKGMTLIWGNVKNHLEEYSWGSAVFEDFQKMMGGAKTDKPVTESKETTDQAIIAYIKTLPADVNTDDLLDQVLAHFPLLHESAHLYDLVLEHRQYQCGCGQILQGSEAYQKHLDGCSVFKEAFKQEEYSEFISKLSDMVNVFTESVDVPVPDKPIVLLKGDDGWHAKVMSVKMGIAVGPIPLLPPGQEKLDEKEKGELIEHIGNVKETIGDFMDSMALLVKIMSGQPLPPTAIAPVEKVVTTGITEAVEFYTQGSGKWTDFIYIKLPKGVTSLTGAVVSGAKESDFITIEVWVGNEVYTQQFGIAGSVTSYVWQPSLFAWKLEGVAGVKVRVLTSHPQKLMIELKYEAEQ